MTGGFHTYIYTNCRADEGLQQRDGFQFQAVSPGANLAAMPLVQRRLLYEPAPQWMRERRPVSDYPPSFAHVCDGNLYATAAGVYLGRESTGSREGNQLTHAIATGDSAAYGLIRPAQLFGAPFWTTEQAPAKQCPPLEPGWQPGPFGVPEAQRFVRSQESGAELLTALVSHLRYGAVDRRVLFVATEPELVLRWVTAATLLIPHREALKIDFKIFTLNPAYADHRILAVHPDWSSGAASLDNQFGYVVFDLVRHEWTSVEDGPDVKRWVRLFLTEDPYDVADAVEVAAEVAAGHPELRSANTSLALAVVLGWPPEPAAIRPITAWLATNPAGMIERYGVDAVDQLLATATRWPAKELVRLDEAVRDNLPERAAEVRLALLRAELRDVEAGIAVQPEVLAPIAEPAWDVRAEATAGELLADALRQAPPEQFEALLPLTVRFGVAPALSLLEPGLQNFVTYWAQHPELLCDPADWAYGPEIEAMLKALLNLRLGDDADPETTDAFGDLWCNALLTRPPDLSTPIDRAVVSAGMTMMDEKERAVFVRDSLQAARNHAAQEAAFRQLTAVLWRRDSPTMAEARRLAALMPKGLVFGAEYFPKLSRSLLEDRVADRSFQAAYTLAEEQKVWLPETPVRTAILQEANIRYVILQLGKTTASPGKLTDLMRRVSAHTLRNHWDPMLDAMVAARLAVAALAVLEAAPELRAEYIRSLAAEVISPEWHPPQMAMAFVLSQMPPALDGSLVEGQAVERLNRALNDFVARSSVSRFDEVDRQIDLLDDHWGRQWMTFTRSRPSRRMIARILRRRG